MDKEILRKIRNRIEKRKGKVYQCSIEAFSVVLDKPCEELVELLGHDGEGYAHDKKGILSKVGVTFQEWIDVCYQLGYALVPITRETKYCNDKKEGVIDYEVFSDPVGRFEGWLKGRLAVIMTGRDVFHLVAWKEGKVIDYGVKYYLKDLDEIYGAWVLLKIA